MKEFFSEPANDWLKLRLLKIRENVEDNQNTLRQTEAQEICEMKRSV